MFLFGRSIFFMFFVPRAGSFLEMPFLVAILKKCEGENDAEGIKTYFPTDFGIIFCNFRQIFFGGRGSRSLPNPLSIYDPAPYFPEGSGPIFHMALFSTPDHPPLAAAILPPDVGPCWLWFRVKCKHWWHTCLAQSSSE